MRTNDEILENITCCTITEDADLDIKENFYYQYEDVIQAMDELRKQFSEDYSVCDKCGKQAIHHHCTDCIFETYSHARKEIK